MHRCERFVIYGALFLLGAANLALLLESQGAAAHAAAPASPGSLGPAESLSLAGAGGDLVLRNRAGRLAWADSDHAQALSVGFVSVDKIVDLLMAAEKYVADRDRLQQEISLRDQDILGRMQAMQAQPGFDATTPEAQQLGAEADRWRTERVQRLGQLAATQIEDAYRDLVAAVDVVADRRGIDLVFRFTPTAEPFEAPGPPAAYTAIRDRLVLRSPATLDITDAVLEELSLQTE